MDGTDWEREKSVQLGVGYQPEGNLWEIIVKYSGDIRNLEQQDPRIKVTELMNEYAILIVPEDAMGLVSAAPEVEFVEKPKRMFFTVSQGKSASCITSVQTDRYQLTGKGTIVAILDSGERVIVMSR